MRLPQHIVVRIVALVLGFASGPHRVAAGDWPQWRGPNRDGVSSEKNVLAGWPEGGEPKVAWRAAVGKGHSAAVIADGSLVSMGWDGQNDTVWCFDPADGALRWKKSYACGGIGQWSGPRSTPAISGGVVYTLGQHGQLKAWSLANGDERWSVTLESSYNPDVDYGFAWSPLISGDFLILSAGSRGLAVRTRDGTFAWGDDGKKGACVSAVPYVVNGRQGVAVMTTDESREHVRLVGIDPATGREQFRSDPWREFWGAACVDPIVAEGKVFLSTAERHKRCARFRIEGERLVEDWGSNVLCCYTGAAVLKDGALYAVNHKGLLKCVDWKTGKELWSQRGFGEYGTLTLADDVLFVQTSAGGEVVAVSAVREGYQELRRSQVFGKDESTFTAPVLSHGRLYCRSYSGGLAALDLRP